MRRLWLQCGYYSSFYISVFLQFLVKVCTNFYTVLFAMSSSVHWSWTFIRILRLFAVFSLVFVVIMSGEAQAVCSVKRDRHYMQYTRDQLLALNTGIVSLDRDTRHRVQSLIPFRTRGCRAGQRKHRRYTVSTSEAGDNVIPVITGNVAIRDCRRMQDSMIRNADRCLYELSHVHRTVIVC